MLPMHLCHAIGALNTCNSLLHNFFKLLSFCGCVHFYEMCFSSCSLIHSSQLSLKAYCSDYLIISYKDSISLLHIRLSIVLSTYGVQIVLSVHSCTFIQVFLSTLSVKKTYHFFEATLTKIRAIKINNIWTHMSFNTPQ